ncbi:hypothetical protein FHS02_001811 [Massilia umbonata]|uniref:Uncharacterized protein n=1 Tax=Pseudoduganella umbonata TaxID=864828 RepID=A0A7W5HBV6_9BURK|nr:hypothetical protein [Pseudoduganella umbonata]
MNPFLSMHLAPRFHFPFGGARFNASGPQAISPGTARFRNPIGADAGIARTVRQTSEAVDVESQPMERQ